MIDGDCGIGFRCVGGSCEQRNNCAADSDCIPGEVCDLARQTCIPSQCANLPVLAVGVARAGVIDAAVSVFSPACTPANAPGAGDLIYQFTLAAAATVSIDVAGIPLFLYLSRTCGVGALDSVACGPGPSPGRRSRRAPTTSWSRVIRPPLGTSA